MKNWVSENDSFSIPFMLTLIPIPVQFLQYVPKMMAKESESRFFSNWNRPTSNPESSTGSRVPQASLQLPLLQLPCFPSKQGELRKHITKHSEQVSAPPSMLTGIFIRSWFRSIPRDNLRPNSHYWGRTPRGHAHAALCCHQLHRLLCRVFSLSTMPPGMSLDLMTYLAWPFSGSQTYLPSYYLASLYSTWRSPPG